MENISTKNPQIHAEIDKSGGILIYFDLPMSISPLVITVVFIETFRIHSYNSGGSVIATGFVRESLKTISI